MRAALASPGRACGPGNAVDVRSSRARRLWQYQRERFPLAAHGPLILALALASTCHALLLAGHARWPDAATLLGACLGAFVTFLVMRVADEHKDAADDARWRPYRPVPRGLVTLAELRALAGIAVLVFVALTLALEPRALLPAGLVALFLALMTREFFVPAWLRARPLLYALSHLAILPLIHLHDAAWAWSSEGGGVPAGFGWFLLATWANGTAFEIARKVRAPHEEELGVETYSALWGRRRAVGAWLAALLVSAAAGVVAAGRVGAGAPAGAVLAGLALVAVAVGGAFLARPRSGAPVRALSAVWTLVLYAVLGPLPMALVA